MLGLFILFIVLSIVVLIPFIFCLRILICEKGFNGFLHVFGFFFSCVSFICFLFGSIYSGIIGPKQYNQYRYNIYSYDVDSSQFVIGRFERYNRFYKRNEFFYCVRNDDGKLLEFKNVNIVYNDNIEPSYYTIKESWRDPVETIYVPTDAFIEIL